MPHEFSPQPAVATSFVEGEGAKAARSRTIRRRIFAGVALLLVAAAGWGLWSRYFNAHPVSGFVVSGRPLEWMLRGPGLVDATNKVSITAKTQGRLAAVFVQRNQTVQKGEVLAEIEADDLKSQLSSAQADAEAALGAVSIARSAEARAKAGLDKVQSDLSRREKLAITGVVSKVDIETLRSSLAQAEAEYQSAQTSIVRAQAQQRAADANVRVMRARLEEMVIRSPVNGVVVQRERNVGDVVLPGAVIVQLVDPDSIIVSGRFDESSMGALTQGRVAKVVFVSAPRTEYPGKVLRVGRQVDQETREFTAEVTLEQLPSNWALGQRATVLVETMTDARLLLAPQSFIQREGGRPYIWVSEGGRSHRRSVMLGAPVGPYVEIQSGVAAGEVLLDPVRRYSYEPVKAQISWP